MAKLVKREVYYFEEPGEQNTQQAAEAVSRRIDQGGISTVVVASTSGNTAVEFAHAMQGKATVICVSGSPFRRERDRAWPSLATKNREALKKLGVIVIENAPYVFSGSVLETAGWGEATPERTVKETLYCFGQGLKVAVEVAFTAVSCGYVPPFEDIIAVGGSGSGADTAIILRGTYPSAMFDKDSKKRLEIREILAMPLAKEWWD